MPSNLNALIRYKTINSCLYGGRRKWSIKELIEACSNALTESRGRYGKVSERTLRDDIRVMRSDILGFNAPIRQKEGLYYYDDPHYSIMAIGITDPDLIVKLIKLLFELRGKVSHPELEIILRKLVSISPDALDKIPADLVQGIPERRIFYSRNINVNQSKIRPPGREIAKDEDALFDLGQEMPPLFSLMAEQKADILWGDVFGVLRTVSAVRGER